MNTNELKDRIGDKTADLQNKAQNTLGELKESTQEWTEKAARKAKSTARDVGAAADLYLHEYAWTTLAAVGVVALLLGILMGSRRN
jgi:ElaB/YqjD/DUF883 family membrane-anchored ribosome-binding protein